jgi:hypothetical protein
MYCSVVKVEMQGKNMLEEENLYIFFVLRFELRAFPHLSHTSTPEEKILEE